MASTTKIEWVKNNDGSQGQSWNFLRGCRRVSEGCTNCYAERQAIRHAGPGGPYEGLVKSTPNGPRWTGEIRSIIEQCKAAQVPVFVKQLGAQPFEPKRYAMFGDAGLYLNNRKGGDPSEWPSELRVREFPK